MWQLNFTNIEMDGVILDGGRGAYVDIEHLDMFLKSELHNFLTKYGQLCDTLAYQVWF